MIVIHLFSPKFGLGSQGTSHLFENNYCSKLQILETIFICTFKNNTFSTDLPCLACNYIYENVVEMLSGFINGIVCNVNYFREYKEFSSELVNC